jgi:hypothetical protein
LAAATARGTSDPCIVAPTLSLQRCPETPSGAAPTASAPYQVDHRPHLSFRVTWGPSTVLSDGFGGCECSPVRQAGPLFTCDAHLQHGERQRRHLVEVHVPKVFERPDVLLDPAQKPLIATAIVTAPHSTSQSSDARTCCRSLSQHIVGVSQVVVDGCAAWPASRPGPGRRAGAAPSGAGRWWTASAES